MTKSGASRAAPRPAPRQPPRPAEQLVQLGEVLKAFPQPPEGFYTTVITILRNIENLLSNKEAQEGKSIDFKKNPHALDNKGKKSRPAAGAKSADRAHSSKVSAPIPPLDPLPAATRAAKSNTPATVVNKNKAAVKANNSKPAAAAENGAKVKFEFITKDIAEAQNEIIVIMTDSNLERKMPGAESLAKKFGAPEKATGLEPEIGSILVQKTADKEIWHLVSKKHPDDKKRVPNKKFYSNHFEALKALKVKMAERNVKRVAISRLGAGYLGVQWRITASKIGRLFADEECEFFIHSLPKKKFSDLESSAAGPIQG
ncbi:MAG: hypothetical protein ACRDCT_20635, partial [Shewanella sp.]